ncbi:odorant receptor 4-like [Camponotus floridanus]|uniref:odorant receptor 4-like n=1 Tax=Camponotus floridanus TaxID=104421 RepID=UPI000DC685AC|nr:odorant receptor 4-like [Camponotus floridanus]XP_025262848.1 odorant receptor 4-like [Camponotus floridanus]
MKVENVLSRTIEIWLRIFGIWPDSSCISLRRLFWIIALAIEQIFHYQYIIIHFYSIEFFEVMGILGETMTFSIIIIKIVTFWCKQRTFCNMLMMMAIDSEKCSSREFSMSVMTRNAKLSRRFANLTLGLYSMAVILHSSHIIVKHTGDDKISNTSTRALVMDMNLPFDLNQTYVYVLIIIIQFAHVLLCSCANGLLNALLINLTLHIGGQIDILCEWLMDIFPIKEKHKPNVIIIKKIIKKHQQIIKFSEYIEDMYSNIALALFVSDTLIICCLGFVIVTSVGTPDAVKIIMRTLLFYFVMNMEAFAFCFAGEYLSTKSNSIGDAAYNSFWYESNSKNNQITLFLIMRSQKQLTITIGKVTNLSLEQFTSIIKASASYISVLLAMN